MQLIDDALFPRPSAPAGVLPAIGTRIDNFAGAVDILRLEARGWIGHLLAVFEYEAVAHTRPGFLHLDLVPAACLCQHGHDQPEVVDLEGDGLRKGRPKTETYTLGQHLRTELGLLFPLQAVQPLWHLIHFQFL